MVSSSGKKNKGRDRKAKKVEAERARVRNSWLGWAVSDRKVTGITTKCNHGCVVPSEDHPVSSFMDDFTTRWFSDVTTVERLIKTLFSTHPQVWNDSSHKKMAIEIMASMGANMLLGKQVTHFSWALRIAKTIAVLENYNGKGCLIKSFGSREIQSKMRDIRENVSSGLRDALKFYSKRTPCSCLKSMHQEARRTIPKMGRCYGCKEEKERASLSVCSRCMVIHYCSRECQVTHWHRHEKDCDNLVNAHLSMIKNRQSDSLE